MPILRWDALRNLPPLQERLNRLFADCFPNPPGSPPDACAWRPPVDIFDDDASIIIQAELPGVGKDAIVIEAKGQVLTIRGERFPGRAIAEERYLCRERMCGTFQRSFALPEPIDPTGIKASFQDGILTIRIQKPAAKKPQKVVIATQAP